MNKDELIEWLNLVFGKSFNRDILSDDMSGDIEQSEQAYQQIKKVIKNERLKHLEEDTVDWFAEIMKKVLAKNRHKENWRESNFFYLMGRLFEEAVELEEAIENFRKDKRTKNTLIKEASDVSNFACFIADIARNHKGSQP